MIARSDEENVPGLFGARSPGFHLQLSTLTTLAAFPYYLAENYDLRRSARAIFGLCRRRSLNLPRGLSGDITDQRAAAEIPDG